MTTRQLSDPTLVKVRVIFAGGAILHLVARDEPEVVRVKSHIDFVKADWVGGADVDAGDTLGYVDWAQVVAVTWRRA
ncbi:MAG TPA: hypothetical protein VIO37_12775 [Candidatus Dormibacteraeota bacterium]|jgi:hypothetical protein